MFRPSWKFEGKLHSIPPQFFVFCFRVFQGGLRFRGLRFLGGLPFRGLRFLGSLSFRGLRFLGGLPFRGLRFLGCLPFRGLRFLGGLSFRGLRFLGGLPFRGLRFLGGLPFRGLRSSVFGLRFLDTHLARTGRRREKVKSWQISNTYSRFRSFYIRLPFLELSQTFGVPTFRCINKHLHVCGFRFADRSFSRHISLSPAQVWGRERALPEVEPSA